MNNQINESNNTTTNGIRLGKLVLDPEIMKAMQSDAEFAQFLGWSLGRFVRKDWGEMTQEGLEAQDATLAEGMGTIHGFYRFEGDADKSIIIVNDTYQNIYTHVAFANKYFKFGMFRKNVIA